MGIFIIVLKGSELKNETLISWTSHVFSLIKEPDQTEGERQCLEREENEYFAFAVNAVDPEKYLNLLQQYASCAAKTMGNKVAWLDGKAPQKTFFDFDTFLQSAGVDFLEGQEYTKLEALEAEHLFVQKAIIPEGSQVCFFGDYHGSIHSCLRNLWRLVAQGYLDTDFRIIKDNFYIVGLGDYVDRGWFGLEVVYTLLLLKMAPGNWDKVFLLKGNHETMNQSVDERSSTGITFFAELACKFGTNKGRRWKYHKQCKMTTIQNEAKELSAVLLLSTLKWYTFLPLALFVGNGNGEFIQCSHGGVEQDYDFSLINRGGEESYQKLEGLHVSEPDDEQAKEREWEAHTGLNWSDFLQKNQHEGKYGDRYIGSHRGCGIMPGVRWTEQYLAKHPFLKGFFRGHQDLFFGFKMLFKPEERPTKKEFGQRVQEMEKKENFDDVLLGLWRSRAEAAVAKEKRDEGSLRYASEEKIRLFHEKLLHVYDQEYKEAQERYTSFYKLAEKMAEYDYNSGPFYWKLVVSERDQVDVDGFLINNYFPAFTFSSAPHGRGLNGNLFPFDCYGILHLTGNYATWRLKVFEYRLANDRNDKYVSISFVGVESGDLLQIQWTDSPSQVNCPRSGL